MLANFKAKLTGAITKLSGRKDLLEAICAASALVAAADGEISDAELKSTVAAVSSSPVLTKAFKPRDIETCIDAMLKRAQSGRMGRAGLFKEIEDIKASQDDCEMVYLAAYDIAESDGKIASAEQKVIDNIAQRLGVSANVANV